MVEAESAPPEATTRREAPALCREAVSKSSSVSKTTVSNDLLGATASRSYWVIPRCLRLSLPVPQGSLSASANHPLYEAPFPYDRRRRSSRPKGGGGLEKGPGSSGTFGRPRAYGGPRTQGRGRCSLRSRLRPASRSSYVHGSRVRDRSPEGQDPRPLYSFFPVGLSSMVILFIRTGGQRGLFEAEESPPPRAALYRLLGVLGSRTPIGPLRGRLGGVSRLWRAISWRVYLRDTLQGSGK